MCKVSETMENSDFEEYCFSGDIQTFLYYEFFTFLFLYYFVNSFKNMYFNDTPIKLSIYI